MRVSSSNLALRFYLKDGWDKKTLDSLVVCGKIIKCSGWEKDLKQGLAYYLPEIGTKLDIDRLMSLVTKVHRAFDDYPQESLADWHQRLGLEVNDT